MHAAVDAKNRGASSGFSKKPCQNLVIILMAIEFHHHVRFESLQFAVFYVKV